MPSHLPLNSSCNRSTIPVFDGRYFGFQHVPHQFGINAIHHELNAVF